ncbi:hypothetical protein [Pelobacter seleniigenes]|uniref:hypothetical protein n=1 Tax=Pelobacter seleniigenes TaxID=407188 RepID=UPI0004A6C6A2|nr:hypothetical protein [Pelobacter seleniigenes]
MKGEKSLLTELGRVWQMHAFVIDTPGCFSLKWNLEKPEIKATQILVPIKKGGFCGSDNPAAITKILVSFD